MIKLDRFRTALEGDKVILYYEGKVIELPWRTWKILWTQAIQPWVQKAEEYELVEKIAKDTAIMRKAGLPWGFSDDPKIKEYAKWMVNNDRDLRRWMGSGVKGVQSDVMFGKMKLKLTDRKTEV
jgi:hypothetical protein